MLKLLVYDRTCTDGGVVGMSTIWSSGARLYRGLDRVNASFGAASWAEALAWLGEYGGAARIAEIQYWGHGKWGCAKIADEALDARWLAPDHAHAALVDRVRDRLLPGGASLVWLRTCESFGADAGIDFARRLADRLAARVAGHTHVIGALQSGLRALEPGRRPTWSATEGLEAGTAASPRRAHASGLLRPRTVHFLASSFADRWFAEDGV